MYRAVALLFLREGLPLDDTNAKDRISKTSIDFRRVDDELHVLLEGEDVSGLIRTPEVTEHSSRVSALSSVRTKLVADQRHIAKNQQSQGSGIVMEGRDIGSVVFPDADVKFFLTASAEERARRRVAEIRQGGGVADHDTVLLEIKQRDKRDESRINSPLIRCPDAIAVDTTGLTFDKQVDLMAAHVRERGGLD